VAPTQFGNTNKISDVFAEMDSPIVPQSGHPSKAHQPTSVSDAFSNINLSALSSGPSTSNVGVLHPLRLTTAEFGQKWGQLSSEQAAGVPTPGLGNLQNLTSAMGANPAYFNVESIPATQEAIYAAVSGTSSTPVLIHVKLQPARKSCDVLVKSGSKQLCQEHVAAVAALLST
jgi:hypothetical protein